MDRQKGIQTVSGSHRGVPMALRVAVLVIVLGGFGRNAPAPASACSCIGTRSGFLIANHSVVPANIGGIPWAGDRERTDAGDFVVERLEDHGWATLAFNAADSSESPVCSRTSPAESPGGALWIIVPDQGFRPGGRYRFTHVGGSADRQIIEIVVDQRRLENDGAPAWIRTGEALRKSLVVWTRAGMCSTSIPAAQESLEIVLPEPWARFKEVLLFGVMVDGQHWRPARGLCDDIPPGLSWVGRGKEIVFAQCGGEIPAAYSLEPGRHRVEMVAWLPGTSLLARADTEVVLECR